MVTIVTVFALTLTMNLIQTAADVAITWDRDVEERREEEERRRGDRREEGGQQVKAMPDVNCEDVGCGY